MTNHQINYFSVFIERLRLTLNIKKSNIGTNTCLACFPFRNLYTFVSYFSSRFQNRIKILKENGNKQQIKLLVCLSIRRSPINVYKVCHQSSIIECKWANPVTGRCLGIHVQFITILSNESSLYLTRKWRQRSIVYYLFCNNEITLLAYGC